MKFLIAIGSKDYSGPTLELGMRVAKAINAEPVDPHGCVKNPGESGKRATTGIEFPIPTLAPPSFYEIFQNAYA